MLYRPNIHKNKHPLENDMISILRGPVTSIRALILIAVYVAAANIPCYTAPSHKVMPRLIFVPPVDSRHNPPTTHTGHNSRNSGDHKMLTTSDPGSNLPTHKYGSSVEHLLKHMHWTSTCHVIPIHLLQRNCH